MAGLVLLLLFCRIHSPPPKKSEMYLNVTGTALKPGDNTGILFVYTLL